MLHASTSCCRPRAGRFVADSPASRRVDPTGTDAIRRRYEADLVRRFAKIKKLLRQAVVQEDVLGLTGNVAKKIQSAAFARLYAAAPVPTRDATAPPRNSFAFTRSADKVQSFMNWLDEAEQEEVLGVVPGTDVSRSANRAWQNVYIDAAYQKGIRDASARLAAEAGTAVPAPGYVNAVFNSPVHADRVGIIYTRSFRDLQGITDAMDLGISRTLALGISGGRGPQDIARNMAAAVDDIGIVRARTLARTEVVNAHAEAALNSYEEAGVEGVSADVEFATAGDDAVCPQCRELEGRVYSVEDARGVIPVHPKCRCAWLPVVS